LASVAEVTSSRFDPHLDCRCSFFTMSASLEVDSAMSHAAVEGFQGEMERVTEKLMCLKLSQLKKRAKKKGVPDDAIEAASSAEGTGADAEEDAKCVLISLILKTMCSASLNDSLIQSIPSPTRARSQAKVMFNAHTCSVCVGCIRPPGHDGPCMDGQCNEIFPEPEVKAEPALECVPALDVEAEVARQKVVKENVARKVDIKYAAEETDAKLKLAQRKEADESARIKAAEDAQKKAAHEAETKRKAAEKEEAARRQAAVVEAVQKAAKEAEAATEAARKEAKAAIAAEVEDAKAQIAAWKKSQEEDSLEAARKKAAEEQAARLKAEEEAARMRAAEEQAALLKAEVEAARKKAAEEQAARQKAEEEAAKAAKAAEEAAEAAAWQKTIEEEEARLKASEEEAARAEEREERRARHLAEEEAELAAMDERCVSAFLECTTLADRVRTPLKGSNLYRLHMRPCRPAGTSVDVKDSSFQNLRNFLQFLEDEGLLRLKPGVSDPVVTQIFEHHCRNYKYDPQSRSCNSKVSTSLSATASLSLRPQMQPSSMKGDKFQ